jgi:hypothetical protein
MREKGQEVEKTLAADAGIAIGPILFIIAILAILAAAIAAGSGGFTASTATESARTKASALIQIGENLKVGMDRVTMENGISLSSVVINPANTSSTTDLFSPTGGGISVPSAALANNPSTDVWMYPQAPLPGLGTSAPEQLAVLSIDPGTCGEVNSKASGAPTPPAADLGNFQMTTIPNSNASLWPFTGATVGCVQNDNPATPGYFFFQVLYIQ